MLNRLRHKHRGMGLVHGAFWEFCNQWVGLFFRVFYRPIVHGVEHIPLDGAALIASNHQSFLDPPLVGNACNTRRCCFVARAGLFRAPLFGTLLRNLDCIEVPEKTNAHDTAAMKASIKAVLAALQTGRTVLIFPESSRSPDGTIQPFDKGVTMLAKRARCPVVPVAVEGPFDAWPRHRKRPKLFGQRLAVRFAPAIDHDEFLADGADAALDRLARTIDTMRLELRAELRQRTNARLPAPGPADQPLPLQSTEPGAVV